MPSSSARSAFSAAARTATPASVLRRNQASPRMMNGTTATMRTSSPISVLLPMSNEKLMGTVKPLWNRGFLSTWLRMMNSRPPTSCASPIDATVATRRDESLNRRITPISRPAPRTMPPITARGSTRKYGQPYSMCRVMARNPKKLPIAA
jgi:hypothetical protein